MTSLKQLPNNYDDLDTVFGDWYKEFTTTLKRRPSLKEKSLIYTFVKERLKIAEANLLNEVLK